MTFDELGPSFESSETSDLISFLNLFNLEMLAEIPSAGQVGNCSMQSLWNIFKDDRKDSLLNSKFNPLMFLYDANRSTDNILDLSISQRCHGAAQDLLRSVTKD